ncbi:MAG: threonine synthase [Oscillospiraceae bacterium]|nr:threonine synthase [Oscillospiraceae bacterium]
MRYISTRDKSVKLSAAGAISMGMARDGGLFVPETIPELPTDAIEKMTGMSYPRRAAYIMSMFLDDFSPDEIREYTEKAYGDNFDNVMSAPVKSLDDRTHFLELWHGPTSAFKDMALQILPYLLTASMKKTGERRRVCILVATSGDTGKAALEGFKDVPGTRILVFFPKNGVSDIQELQMTTQQGDNVGVMQVRGNFDDAQTGVKKLFSDEQLRAELDGRGWFLSSANSINWGRLLPQVVYYISTYVELVKDGKISNGDKINFCVPTGNFGDILAGFYAMRMGLPVNKLICASNSNDVLTEFFETGVYNRLRPFHTTVSPSMDILISSNLERLLFEMSGADDRLTASYMKLLNEEGSYKINDELKSAINAVFACGRCSEEETRAAIAGTWKDSGYLIDTHTAVAYHVLREYRRKSGDGTPSVVVSTASPYKFCKAVLESIGRDSEGGGLDLLDRLSEATAVAPPKNLSGLRSAQRRFEGVCEKEGMAEELRAFLK